MNTMPTNPEEFMKMITDMMPKVTTNANGYEIRTTVLGMANAHVKATIDFEAHRAAIAGDFSPNTMQEFLSVAYPNTDKVIETAKKFMDFVNTK
jgi:hypothetical protein